MSKKSILIVDDEIEFPELARLVLTQKGGYEVGVCHHGEKAVEAIREWKPDLVLLDIMMPNKDGTEIAAELRSDPELCAISVIFFTSLMTPQEAKAHPILKNHDFIAKPVTAEDLLEKVREFFASEA